MSKRWLTIGDVQRLVKQKMYQLETGSKSGDQLIYDRKDRKYVGHIEGNNFHQSSSYIPPTYITKTLQEFDNDWNDNDFGW